MIIPPKTSLKSCGKECSDVLHALEDTLYVIGGKWKVKILTALRHEGNMRFNQLQRSLAGISARVLSNELKDLELNGFVQRKVFTSTPVVVEYELTGYSDTLDEVLGSMIRWGIMHRRKLKREAKNRRAVKAGSPV